MDVAARELKSFCEDVSAVLGETLASKGFMPYGSTVGLDRAECDYCGKRADLRFYYFRPDGEVNCLIRDRSGQTPSEWKYLTTHLDWGAGLTDEEWADATDTADHSIKGALQFYEPPLAALTNGSFPPIPDTSGLASAFHPNRH